MADDSHSEDEGMDNAMTVFGTPERELRRRWLHPLLGGRQTEEEDVDEGSQPTQPEPVQDDEEPLQQARYTPSKADRIVSLIFHLSAAFFFVYMRLETDRTLAWIKEEKGLTMPESDTYGGKFKFLTFLNFNMQIIYFILALLCDLLYIRRDQLQKFRDFIFTTTVLPCALVVTSMFWILTTFLREYAVGETGGPVDLVLNALPPHINHASHTAVGFMVVIEALIVYHRYPSNSEAIKTMFIWNTAYALWCFYYAGVMPYPLFYTLGPFWVLLNFLLFFIVSTVSYFFGKKVTSLSWAGEVN